MKKTKVEYGKIPLWLKRKICAKFKGKGPADQKLYQLRLGSWFDHWGTVKGMFYGHEKVFVAEPYNIGIESIDNINKFATELELEVTFSGNADHNDSCFRISFWPKDEPHANDLRNCNENSI